MNPDEVVGSLSAQPERAATLQWHIARVCGWTTGMAWWAIDAASKKVLAWHLAALRWIQRLD